MTGKKISIFIVIVIIVILVLMGVNHQQKPSELKIGAVLPLTGDIASYGKRAQKGILLALDQINNSSEYEKKIYVDFQDGKGNAQESVAIMKKFCAINRYPVVIGAAASSVSMAIAPIANDNHVVQISPISSSPDLTTKGGDYFFRVCPSDVFQAVILAEWIKEKGFEKIGVLFIQNSWGQSLKDKFVEEFQVRGGKIVVEESCKEGDRDFRTQLTKFIASKPEAIYCPTYGKEGGLILKQLKELGFTGMIFGSDVWSAPELLTSAGDSAEGVFLVKPSEYKDDKYEDFKNKYFSKYNEQPDVYSAYAYDIMMILAKALDIEGINGKGLRDYLMAMPAHNGATGETKFDKNGDCNTKLFSRYQIQDDKLILMTN